jgi:micrococcal nuclease
MRKKFVINGLTILSLIIFKVVISLYNDDSQSLEAKVVKVLDGDTVIVEQQGDRSKHRLLYIDAPEKGQVVTEEYLGRIKYINTGELSTEYLKNLVLGKNITIKSRGKDIYKRFLSVLYLGKQNVNLKMVCSGMAHIYYYAKFHGKFTKEKFEEGLRIAKQEKKGIWRFKANIDPYKFRKKSKR